MNTRTTVVAVLLLLTAIGTSSAFAESDMIGIGEDKFSFAAGTFLPAFNTKVRVEGDNVGPGDDVDLENDLGIDRNDTSIYLGASWRFSPKHRILGSFFQSSRQSEVVANKDIQIGDEIYPAGATLKTKLSFNVVPVTYAYSLMQSERSELAVTGGLHWNSIKLKVEGSASAGNKDVDTEIEAKVDAPMPLLGLDYVYAFTPRWTGGARGEVFWFDYSGGPIDVGGTIVNLRLSTDYWITRNIGLGAAVNYFELDVDVDSDKWKGTLNYGYFGPQIYLQARI
jgi:hypothetical protein